MKAFHALLGVEDRISTKATYKMTDCPMSCINHLKHSVTACFNPQACHDFVDDQNDKMTCFKALRKA